MNSYALYGIVLFASDLDLTQSSAFHIAFDTSGNRLQIWYVGWS